MARKPQVEIKGIIGVNQMIKELRLVEPELYRQLRKDLINDVKPLYRAIKSNIPPVAPLSGLNNNGRLGWGKPVKVSAKINLKQRRGFTTLLTVRTENAAVEMIDMAGSRTTGNTPQGRAMIANLSGKASRYVWPAANRYLPQIIQAANGTLERYSKIKNRTLEFIPKS
jgi:hypothetical protein